MPSPTLKCFRNLLIPLKLSLKKLLRGILTDKGAKTVQQ